MISIIIPTYNEGEGLGSFLVELQSREKLQNEIIVVDATNCAKTKDICLQRGVKFLSSEKGRAVQMNRGAQEANGSVLYFLHADSLPPEGFDQSIIGSINDGNQSGCFYMQFDSDHLVLRASGWFTRFSSDWCRGGDQSLFVKSSIFREIGGFNEEMIILEDNEIIPRLKRSSDFVVIQEKLITSARRYRENGVVRLQILFALIHIGYRFGISQNSLLRFYQRHVN